MVFPQRYGYDNAEPLQRPGARTFGLGADFQRRGLPVQGREGLGAGRGYVGYH